MGIRKDICIPLIWVSGLLLWGCGTDADSVSGGEEEAFLVGLPADDSCVRFTPHGWNCHPTRECDSLFSTETCDTRIPILGVEAESFVLTENQSPIPEAESHLQILPRCVGYDFLNILLIDGSGSMLQDGAVQNVVSGAKFFANQVVADEQPLAIYIFDGNPEAELLVDFTTDKSTFGALESLKTRVSTDTSTNLNGSIADALALLDQRFKDSTALHFEGTVTVLTDGEDQASRVSTDGILQAMEATEHSVYAIGLGGGINVDTLSEIGKDGFFQLADLSTISEPFGAIASTLIAASQNYYVIGYCSPKRAGVHGIQLRVDGYTGVLNAEFDASKFEGGCDAESIINNATLDAKSCVLSPPWEGTAP